MLSYFSKSCWAKSFFLSFSEPWSHSGAYYTRWTASYLRSSCSRFHLYSSAFPWSVTFYNTSVSFEPLCAFSSPHALASDVLVLARARVIAVILPLQVLWLLFSLYAAALWLFDFLYAIDFMLATVFFHLFLCFGLWCLIKVAFLSSQTFQRLFSFFLNSLANLQPSKVLSSHNALYVKDLWIFYSLYPWIAFSGFLFSSPKHYRI